MPAPTTFYSASAGSGKTFALARDYLTLLFKNYGQGIYRNILAVTFTNKAVAEMKSRILEYLYLFSTGSVDGGVEVVASHIMQVTGMAPDDFQKTARSIHNRILHDYSSFDIVTIDAFNHRLLQTFSRDLNLPDGFEVELDIDELFSRAVRSLLSRAGENKELTDVLVDFSLSKIDDGKSWNIEYDLMEIAQFISSENNFKHLELLKSKSLVDFLRFRESVITKLKQTTKDIVQQATQVVAQVRDSGLEPSDFYGGARGPYGVVVKIASGNLSTSPETAGAGKLAAGDFYKKSSSQGVTASINALEPELRSLGENYGTAFYQIDYYRNILSQLTSLSLLNSLLKEVEKIKEEERIVPIYEFNGLLTKEVSNQPAPFIYERLGERYAHFFIDEFQDTSTMQWANLSPLIANALSQDDGSGNRGSLMLVGDAKQAIYRWRGGNADQFLHLLGLPAMFMREKINENLEFNWRSHDMIIDFNNGFFEYYGGQLQSDVYKSLYAHFLEQKPTGKEGGYVQIDLLDEKLATDGEGEEVDSQILQSYEIATRAIERGFLPGEICILTRTNAQGREIAQYLMNRGLKVVSGDSLLVSLSPRVKLLVALLRLVQDPEESYYRYDFLLQYHKLNGPDLDFYSWMDKCLSMPLQQMIGLITDRYTGFELSQKTLYGTVEELAIMLDFFDEIGSRFIAFMDHVFEFSQKAENTLPEFLDNWESVSGKLNVPASMDSDAIQLMTIHKSKGLEFPVVIVPYCDKAMTLSRTPMGWLEVDPEDHSGFEEVYVSLKKSITGYSGEATQLYEEHREKTQMDHINTLYVAFTRAREQLYIIAQEPKSSSASADPKQSLLIQNYAMDNQLMESREDGFTRYVKGDIDRKTPLTTSENLSGMEISTPAASTARTALSTRRGQLWGSGADQNIFIGNIVHNYLSLVETTADLADVLVQISYDDSLNKEEQVYVSNTVENVVNHPDLASYFSDTYKIFTEQPLLMPDGAKLVPDRMLLRSGSMTIVDYKTGQEDDKHRYQLESYADQIKQMGFAVDEKILVYTDNLMIKRWN